MLAPKTCNCDTICDHNRNNFLAVADWSDGTFNLRPATEEEKRQHRIEYLRWRERELEDIRRELAGLSADVTEGTEP